MRTPFDGQGKRTDSDVPRSPRDSRRDDRVRASRTRDVGPDQARGAAGPVDEGGSACPSGYFPLCLGSVATRLTRTLPHKLITSIPLQAPPCRRPTRPSPVVVQQSIPLRHRKRSVMSPQPHSRHLQRAALGVLTAGALVTGVLVGAGPSQAATSKPCDIYASGGTPCVAAHSTTRALYAAYTGSLYQVQRASDSTTLQHRAAGRRRRRQCRRPGLVLCRARPA